MREKLSAIQVIDVSFRTTDGRCLMMPHYTEPDADLALMLHQLRQSLPNQPRPRITALASEAKPTLKMVVQTF
ncbi:MAG: hypothetical protein HY235_04245 [Acidobacteria bacterium]|nr:hypothetical protein [Acidobacteriota bacterium]